MYLVCTRDGEFGQHFVAEAGRHTQPPTYEKETAAREAAMRLAATHPGQKYVVIRVVGAYVADQVREIPA